LFASDYLEVQKEHKMKGDLPSHTSLNIENGRHADAIAKSNIHRQENCCTELRK